MTKAKKPEDKEKVGRKRSIDSPKKFDELVDGYINICKATGEPILLTGMVLALGLTSKQSLYYYKDYPEFFESVKRALLLVEMEYEKDLKNGKNAAAAIFALKNFGWKDNLEVDINAKIEAPSLNTFYAGQSEPKSES